MKIIDPYKETVRLSPNHGRAIKPSYIMLHHSDGSISSNLDWIGRSESKVSYHYLIDDKDGNRYQLVWDSKRAWHAGKGDWNGNRDMNSYSVGIAFTGNTYKRAVSEAEIDSCAHKCLYLMAKFSIPISNIITHQMYAPNRKDDCSPNTYNRVLERIKELI